MWGITASKTSASFALKCGFLILTGRQDRKAPCKLQLLSVHLNRHETLRSVPLYVSHEDSNEVKDLLQTFSRGLQDVVGKSTQEDEKISQVFYEKL